MSLRLSLPVSLRSLASDAGSTALAIGLLGVALGAAAAAFSILHATVLNPLPFPGQDQLALVWQTDPSRSVPVVEVSYRNYLDLRERTRSFSDFAAVSSVNMHARLSEPGPPAQLPCAAVSASFFSTLRTQPLIGRVLLPSDDTVDAPPTIVLSHGLWTQRFGGETSVLDRQVRLDFGRGAQSVRIVGVMPQEFDFPSGAQLWAPLGSILRDQALNARYYGVLYGLGRLAPHANIADATRELDGLFTQVYPDAFGQPKAVVTPLTSYLLGPSRTAMWAVFGLGILVWLLACANVAGLLLVRWSSRQREVAVQRALGASAWNVARVWLLQACAITIGAGLVAIFVAEGARRAVVTLAASNVPRIDDAAFQWPVIVFGLGLAAIAVLLAGALPAFYAARAVPMDVLKRHVGHRRSHAQRWVVLGELSLAVIALAAAAHLVRAVLDLERLDLGFRSQGVLTMDVLPDAPELERWNAFYDQFLDRVRALPGVQSAGAVYLRPLRHGPIGLDASVVLEGQSGKDIESWRHNPLVNLETVTPGYFEALQIPTRHGRVFTTADRQDTQNVVVVSESTASRLWPGRNPIGQIIGTPTTRRKAWQVVIGVVADVHYRGINDRRLDVYMPAEQTLERVKHAMIRTAGDPLALVDMITQTARALDSAVVVENIATMPQIVDDTTRVWRLTRTVALGFGVLAVLVAGIGLYALLAQTVQLGGYELAVRSALGARPIDLSRSVLTEAVTLALLASVVGLALSVPAMRLVRALDVSRDRTDVLGPLVVVAAALLAAIIATALPAIRAARVAPAAVLRGE